MSAAHRHLLLCGQAMERQMINREWASERAQRAAQDRWLRVLAIVAVLLVVVPALASLVLWP